MSLIDVMQSISLLLIGGGLLSHLVWHLWFRDSSIANREARAEADRAERRRRLDEVNDD